MIQITDAITIADKDFVERFIRACGPGGQNARHDETAVELRYDVARSPLPDDVKLRLLALAGRHIDSKGILVIESRACRSQAANRDAAHKRLVALLRRAAQIPVHRRPTHPRRTDREMRMAEKRIHGAVKRRRSRPREE